MSNRLTKLAQASYTPGTPGQPYVPARCVQESYLVPGYQQITTQWVVNESGEYYPTYSYGPWVPAHVEYREVCYPAQPYIAAVPATTTYQAITGWNGGARSIGQIDADGFVEFQVKANPFGAVVGLSDTDNSLLPSEPTHGLYIHGTVVDVIQSGAVVHTASISHAYANVYKIERVGTTITYSSGAWSYVSAVPRSNGVFIDVALYASGDYVDNPTIESTGAGTWPTTGSGAGTLPALFGVASYDSDYHYAVGALPALSGDANGGYPQVSIITGVGVLGLMLGSSVGYTGEVGQAVGTLGALAGLASEGAYGEVRGTLPMLSGYADEGWPIEGEKAVFETLVIGDQYFPDLREHASMSETLGFTDEFAAALEVDGSYYDTLLLGDTLTATQALEVVLMEALRLGDDLSGVLRIDLPGGLVAGEPMQYAVNVLTGAITTYSGFGFTGFARSGQQLYACKPDGVYWVRPGDDAGQPRQGFIDFGASDFGSTGTKSVESVYLGIQTDGQLVLRLKDDAGTERLYRVIQRSPMMRALTAKGVGARKWNVALEIIDATEFELDTLEVQVGISRRWGSR